MNKNIELDHLNHVLIPPSDTEMDAVRTLLAMYDDTSRDGLQDTPRRVVQMYRELLTPKDFEFTTFPAEKTGHMIVVQDISFYTLCEHHLLPFYGTATVGYIPTDTIAGLSKVARTVEYFARRLQTQERFTDQVADFLMEKLNPMGVGVVLKAQHLCMAMRGVEKPGTVTTTSALRKAFIEKPEVRTEFFTLAYKD